MVQETVEERHFTKVATGAQASQDIFNLGIVVDVIEYFDLTIHDEIDVGTFVSFVKNKFERVECYRFNSQC